MTGRCYICRIPGNLSAGVYSSKYQFLRERCLTEIYFLNLEDSSNSCSLRLHRKCMVYSNLKCAEGDAPFLTDAKCWFSHIDNTTRLRMLIFMSRKTSSLVKWTKHIFNMLFSSLIRLNLTLFSSQNRILNKEMSVWKMSGIYSGFLDNSRTIYFTLM